MILKNKKGTERKFRVLFELDKDNKEFIIYEDINTLNIYGGKKDGNILKPLDDSEYILLNDVLEKIK